MGSENVYIFDASSLIFMWDTYPVESRYFHKLWFEWFAGRVNRRQFVISDIAYTETAHSIDDFKEWCKEHEIAFHVFSKTNSDINMANKIERQLGIDKEGYHRDGVDKNDVWIISIAKRIDAILVSNEARQEKLPHNPTKYKIPAVCALSNIAVRCIDFVALLRQEAT